MTPRVAATPGPGLVALVGTDTGVGKSHVTAVLARGLRAAGRRVWLHKPVACGGWDGTSAEDGRWHRALAAEQDDGQPAATVCPHEFPAPCSPHLAAQEAGAELDLAGLAAALATVRSGAAAVGADLLIEGVGGLLSPLARGRETIADLLVSTGIPLLIVTRPHLGTLNHTALTVQVARARGLDPIGLAVNHHPPVEADSLAVRSAAGELAAVTGLAVLAELPSGATGSGALTAGILAAWAR